jgi:hypothetical protein
VNTVSTVKANCRLPIFVRVNCCHGSNELPNTYCLLPMTRLELEAAFVLFDLHFAIVGNVFYVGYHYSLSAGEWAEIIYAEITGYR